MIFKVRAGTILCGILLVGSDGSHRFKRVNGLETRRTNRVAKIAGYKQLSLERVM